MVMLTAFALCQEAGVEREDYVRVSARYGQEIFGQVEDMGISLVLQTSRGKITINPYAIATIQKITPPEIATIQKITPPEKPSAEPK